MSADDHARAVAFLRRGDLGGAREEPSTVGTAVFDDDLALRHDSNHLVVERDCTPEQLVAEVRRTARPTAWILDDGHRWAASLAALARRWMTLCAFRTKARRSGSRNDGACGSSASGWPAPSPTGPRTAAWSWSCAATRRAPPRRAPTCARSTPRDLRPLRAAALAPYPWATPPVIEHLLAAKAGIARRVTLRCFAAFVDGEVASYTDLYLGDGVAQVEDVATAERHRNRGLATAVVLRATDEARRAGAGLTFLCAAEDDWPKHLYARLGFDVVGRYVKLVTGGGSA